MNRRLRQPIFADKLLLVAIHFFLITALALAGFPASAALPSQITTTDGQTYHAVKLLRVLPDGLLIRYLPVSGGMGLARLKFTKLPPAYRRQFGYDPAKASDFEKAEQLAMTELSRQMREDEAIRTATLTETAGSSVTVEASPPVVHYAYYDPAGPKPMGITEDMSGDTTYQFSCIPIFTFHVTQQGAGAPFDFHIKTLTLQLGVTININLPTGKIGKLKKHENGHKKIVEYFYSLGPAAARQAGGLVTGLEQTSSATNFATAKQEVFTKASQEVLAAYLDCIQDRCRQANNYYDKLTNHGRNRVDSNQAAEEAIRRYALQVTN